MRNAALCAIAFIYSITASAQHVLMAATNNPVIGDLFYVNACNTTGTFDTTSGAGVNWDYSGLTGIETDTVSFVSCVGTPYIDSFPGSNIAYQYGATGFYYYNVAADSWTETGILIPPYGAYYFSKPRIELTYPLTYGDTTIDTGVYYNLSGNAVITIEDSTFADAYGTLILPTGTYANVLRLHKIVHAIDSFSTGNNYYRSDEYLWFQPGFHYQLLTIGYTLNFSGMPAVTGITYTSRSTLGIGQVNKNDLDFYVSPNPANKFIKLKFLLANNEQAMITISDIIGREMGKINSTDIKPGANDIRYTLPDVSPGIYLVHLQSAEHNVTKKIVVER